MIISRSILLFYHRYSALGPVWAETRAQSGDRYGSGTLHPGQVLRGSLPLLSSEFYFKREIFQMEFIEKIKTHILWSTFPASSSVNETLCKNMVETGKPQMT